MSQATVSELTVGMEIPEFQRATGLHNWNRYAAVNSEFVDIHMDDEAGQAAGYPGQQFGLPQRGSGSVASMPRRLLALLIDWLLSMLIAYWLTGSQFWTIAVFAIEVYVLTATTGFTIGKRLVGIRTVRTNGGLVGFRWALVRTAILLTVIPPLLTDRDLRGLHDRASDTVVIRL